MTPHRPVRITSAGRAQDGALLAAADVAAVAAALEADYRLVGGNAAPPDWSDRGAGREARQVLLESFGRPEAGGLSRASRVRAEQTRIRALITAVVGVP